MVGRRMFLCVNLRFTPLFKSLQLLGLRAFRTVQGKVGHRMFTLNFAPLRIFPTNSLRQPLQHNRICERMTDTLAQPICWDAYRFFI